MTSSNKNIGNTAASSSKSIVLPMSQSNKLPWQQFFANAMAQPPQPKFRRLRRASTEPPQPSLLSFDNKGHIQDIVPAEPLPKRKREKRTPKAPQGPTLNAFMDIVRDEIARMANRERPPAQLPPLTREQISMGEEDHRSDLVRQEEKLIEEVISEFQEAIDNGEKKVEINLNPKYIVLAIQRFPDYNFIFKADNKYVTLNRENVARIMKEITDEEMPDVAENEQNPISANDFISKQHDVSWTGYQGFFPTGVHFVEGEVDIRIIAKRKPSRKKTAGGFFNHINMTNLDLRRYGIYKDEAEIECNENCLYQSLREGGFPQEKLQDLGSVLRTRDVPESRLKEVCEKFSIRIKLIKHLAEKEGQTDKNGKNMQTSRTTNYGKNGKVYNIGLVDEHYFVNERTEITAYSLKHYDEVKDLKDWHKIECLVGKRYQRSSKAGIESFKVVQHLLNNNLTRPIVYCTDIMATPFSDKFKNQKIVLTSVPDECCRLVVEPEGDDDTPPEEEQEEQKEKKRKSNAMKNFFKKRKLFEFDPKPNQPTKGVYYLFEDDDMTKAQIDANEELMNKWAEHVKSKSEKDRLTFLKKIEPSEGTIDMIMAATGHKQEDIEYRLKADNLAWYYALEKEQERWRERKTKELEKESNTVLRYFFDFETDTSGAQHESYGISVYVEESKRHKIGAKHKWFEGKYHTDDAMRWILDDVFRKTDSFKKLESTTVMLLAHNLSYDVRFLMKHLGCTGVLQKGSKTLTANCFRTFEGPLQPNGFPYMDSAYYGHKVKLLLKDTLCLIPQPLEKFGKMFKLDTEKEVMPYGIYTARNIEKRMCTVREAVQEFERKDQFEKIDPFIKNLKKLNMLTTPREDIDIMDCTFDIMKYSEYYCMKDTEVLAKGYKIFRNWIRDGLGIDIDHVITISSVAREFMKKEGVFDGVYEFSGSVRAFIQQCLVGGRTMTNSNKKIVAEGKLADFDCTSLYSSAMVRLGGFLLGKPKLLEESQLNKEFLDKQDGYYVHTKFKIGKAREFPLASAINEDGTRMFTNDVTEAWLDKTSVEDLIKFQEAEFEFLNGVYFNEGRNNKLGEVITKLFELRAHLKNVEKNPAQEVYKLILNSAYGFTLMKAQETDTQIKKKDEWEKYLERNFQHIKEAIQLSDGKFVVKTYKAVDDHFVPNHCGIEVLSSSKRIMNEVMCLAEDEGIKIFYQDTDSMHLFAKDIPRLADAYEREYDGKPLIGDYLGQFHTDFEMKDCKDVLSILGIFLGKKAYLDILQGVHEKTGEVEQDLHIRQKGVPEDCVLHTAKSFYHQHFGVKAPSMIEAVKELYMYMLTDHGEGHKDPVLKKKAIQKNAPIFDLTNSGKRPCFQQNPDFTIQNRSIFD